MLIDIKKYIETMGDTNLDYFTIYKSLIDKFYSVKNESIYEINFVFYDKFKIQPENHIDTSKLCINRLGQTKFRQEVVNFYNNCIITGDDNIICQACHILPYSETKYNHVDNGLLLNYNFHQLFDSFLISFKFKEKFDDIFDLYYVVISSKIINKHTFSNYKIYNDKVVKINTNSKNFLKKKL